MIDVNDTDGRLIVVFQVERKTFCVFVEGQWDSEFPSGREELAFARSQKADNKDAE